MASVSVTDKLILVTGATSGIGEVTARELARQGAHVIMLARNADKAEKLRQQLLQETGNQHIDVVLADLADLDQVRRVAAELHQKYPHLDVLVNNAGLMLGKERETSPQGNELTLATNHLGPFLLTSLLLDMLQKSTAARIVNVASDAYKFSKPTLDDVQSERYYNAVWEYGNTKLWNIMFTQELAQRLRAHGIQNVVTNCLHPGAVATNYGKLTGGIVRAVLELGRPFMISPEKGAQTTLFLVTDEQAGQSSGGYYAKRKPVAVKSKFNTADNNHRLWEISEKLIGTNFLD